VPGPPASLQAALPDRYLIERELGRGGVATVYLARDLKHRRPVALKVLNPTIAASLGADRFLREIELAARLQHPHILTGPFALALAYAGQGKLTQAFEFLDRSIQVRDIFMPEDFFDPLLDPLRADPRFARIEQRMGITRQPGPRP
jgi:serine/threonine protein kinase